MKLAIIVAVDLSNGIGQDNDLLWSIPLDMKRFKQLTTNHPIIMGRKTFESIGKPLPNRINIVVTRDRTFRHDGVKVFHNMDDAIYFAKGIENEISFIIGGSEIYQQSIDKVDELYVTHIHATSPCNKYFPKIDTNKWNKTFSEHHVETVPQITFMKYEKFISK